MGNRGERVWRASINQAPPSANEFMRTHFRKRKELAEVWYALLYSAFFHEGITRAKGKRSVVITVVSKHERDHQNNYLAADKLILDNLTRLGWLVDDSPEWLTLTLYSATGTPRTGIEVRE